MNGNLFASVCDLLHIVKKRTTPYRPCSNGQVERYNRTLLQLIRCFLQGNHQTWDEHLPQLAGAIRSTINRNTGFTPNLRMLGHEVILPVNLMIGIAEGENKTPAEYVLKLRTILNKVHTLARENLVSTQMRQKKDYDLRLKENTYEVGDLVYSLDSARKIGQSSKLQQIWKGPMLVTKVLTPILFEVTGRKKPVVIHHDRLKPCCDRNIPIWLHCKRNQLLGYQSELSENTSTCHEDDDLNLSHLFEVNCQDTADSGMEANDSLALEKDLKVITTDEGNQEVNKPSVTRVQTPGTLL